MNKCSRLLILAALFCMLFSLQASGTGLTGTKHDFSRDDPSNPFREIGKICTPCHRYVNSPPKATIDGQPVKVKATRVCLACHSGASENGEDKVGNKFIKDFSFHHPVDIPMPDNSAFISKKEVQAQGIIFYGPENLIACTSCHDTHNAKNIPFFLRDQMDEGQLCRNCHNK